jgi:hypothetical protein
MLEFLIMPMAVWFLKVAPGTGEDAVVREHGFENRVVGNRRERGEGEDGQCLNRE